MKELAKQAQHLATSKICCYKDLTIFKLDAIDPMDLFFKKHFLNNRLSICNKQRGVMVGGGCEYHAKWHGKSSTTRKQYFNSISCNIVGSCSEML